MILDKSCLLAVFFFVCFCLCRAVSVLAPILGNLSVISTMPGGRRLSGMEASSAQHVRGILAFDGGSNDPHCFDMRLHTQPVQYLACRIDAGGIVVGEDCGV